MGKRHARSTGVWAKPSAAVQTAIKTTPPPPAPLVARPVMAKPDGGLALVAYRVVWTLASLRLTVLLFALSLLLIFFGTLAQMDKGIYTILHDYFRTGLTWVPFQLFVRFGQVFFGVSQSLNVPGSFPFPGGWLLGTLLLVNILAAHAVRFRISWKRSGVLILHSGLIVLMLGEFVAGIWQQEGRMEIWEGASSNYTQDYHKVELAVVDPSNPSFDTVTVVPGSLLHDGATIRDDRLPFDIDVVEYLPNASRPLSKSADPENAVNHADSGEGRSFVLVKLPPVSGTESDIDTPGAFVRVRKKNSDQSLGTYLLTTNYLPEWKQTVNVDGKDYQISLRFAREYRPYRLHLIKFSFERYGGTGIAKEYSSRVRIDDPERNEHREVLISMNDPLRYRGDVFYQSDFDRRTEKATVLQVVSNPGWLLPYISCVLVALGMLVHFGLHLFGFLQRRFAL
jgi:hypothetical protein